MSSYVPLKYWAELAANRVHDDQQGFAAVLHPGAPHWFNSQIDALQARVWSRAVGLCRLPCRAKVLDLGCGTGRWIRRYAAKGLSPVGLDASLSMLRRAAELRANSVLLSGTAQSLPLRENSFDCVSTVTVLQHIPQQEQRAAIKELVRVTRAGGYIILLELIRGKGAHVFPHTPAEWVAQVESCGPRLVSWSGQEFLLLDRLVTRAIELFRQPSVRSEDALPFSTDTKANHPKFHDLLRRMHWTARWISMHISFGLEPVAARICPRDWATHAVFVFRKPEQP